MGWPTLWTTTRQRRKRHVLKTMPRTWYRLVYELDNNGYSWDARNLWDRDVQPGDRLIMRPVDDVGRELPITDRPNQLEVDVLSMDRLYQVPGLGTLEGTWMLLVLTWADTWVIGPRACDRKSGWLSGWVDRVRKGRKGTTS